MFYQNILTEISPYHIRVARIGGFGEHRHADVEIHYCLKGSLNVLIHKKARTIKEGELLLISPMVAHSFPPNEDSDSLCLTIVVGVSFLKKYFSYFSQAKNEFYVVKSDEEEQIHKKLRYLLDETADLCSHTESANDLMIRGNLYKVCAYLVDMIAAPREMQKTGNKEIAKVASIEKALEMIYYDYAKPLTVEDAAAATGYGKSNFCKIFKGITGDTFHNVLNKQRVESACGLLSETDLSVAQIATQVGFGETKTFCRVFKAVTSVTPGQYRINPKL